MNSFVRWRDDKLDTILRRCIGYGALILTLSISAAVTAQGGQTQTPANPHQMHHHTMAGPAPDMANRIVKKMTIPDLEVLDQNGEKVHFYNDLVKHKVVAINFIFTTCTTICPPMAATFSRIQKLMGGRIGKDARLISISVDPVTDTPERLKAWSQKFGAKPGWTLVTGDKGKMDELLKDLGGFTPDKQDHSSIVLIGNEETGTWTRAYGLAPASKLVSLIEGMIADTSAHSPARKEGRQ